VAVSNRVPKIVLRNIKFGVRSAMIWWRGELGLGGRKGDPPEELRTKKDLRKKSLPINIPSLPGKKRYTKKGLKRLGKRSKIKTETRHAQNNFLKRPKELVGTKNREK